MASCVEFFWRTIVRKPPLLHELQLLDASSSRYRYLLTVEKNIGARWVAEHVLAKVPAGMITAQRSQRGGWNSVKTSKHDN
jgi:hypothetical protein